MISWLKDTDTDHLDSADALKWLKPFETSEVTYSILRKSFAVTVLCLLIHDWQCQSGSYGNDLLSEDQEEVLGIQFTQEISFNPMIIWGKMQILTNVPLIFNDTSFISQYGVEFSVLEKSSSTIHLFKISIQMLMLLFYKATKFQTNWIIQA